MHLGLQFKCSQDVSINSILDFVMCSCTDRLIRGTFQPLSKLCKNDLFVVVKEHILFNT